MKKIFIPFLLITLTASVYAIERTAAKIQGVGDPACVSVSSTTWTAVPSTSTIRASRGGIILSAPGATVGAFNVVFTSNAITTPSVATSVHNMDLIASQSEDLSVSQFVYIFAVSTHTGAATQNLCYQEYTLELGK